MKLEAGVLCFAAASLLLARPVGSCQESSQEGSAVVEGLAVDILDGRIPDATVTFWRGANEVVTKTRYDGTYSLRLMPGTYTMSVSKEGFYTARRAAYILQEHSSVRFNFQMWVSVYDLWPVFHYDELDEVSDTNLKPLILYGKNESQGDLQHFHGWNTPDDGTRHARQYP